MAPRCREVAQVVRVQHLVPGQGDEHLVDRELDQSRDLAPVPAFVGREIVPLERVREVGCGESATCVGIDLWPVEQRLRSGAQRGDVPGLVERAAARCNGLPLLVGQR